MDKIQEFCSYKAVIKVLGVGDSGINVIENMIENNLYPQVEFVVANTNTNSLRASSAGIKITLGRQLTNGLGTGTNPQVGRQAAIEAKDELLEVIKCDLLFIFTGMGGGTGSGAAPVIAELARSCSVLTVGIVTRPFSFEGRTKSNIADRGIEALRQHVDSLIVIPNENLLGFYPKSISLFEAFKPVDDVLRQAVEGILEIVLSEGVINIDFADVKAALECRGVAVMGVGTGEGKERASMAATSAISCPMLENRDISGAKWVLVNISGSSSMTMDDFNSVSRVITDQLSGKPSIKIGVVRDEELGDSLKVTIVATGFDSPSTSGR